MATKGEKMANAKKAAEFLQISNLLEPLLMEAFNFACETIVISCLTAPDEKNATINEIKEFEERLSAAANRVKDKVENYAIAYLSANFTDKELGVVLKFLKDPVCGHLTVAHQKIIASASEITQKAIEKELETFDKQEPKKDINIQ